MHLYSLELSGSAVQARSNWLMS